MKLVAFSLCLFIVGCTTKRECPDLKVTPDDQLYFEWCPYHPNSQWSMQSDTGDVATMSFPNWNVSHTVDSYTEDYLTCQRYSYTFYASSSHLGPTDFAFGLHYGGGPMDISGGGHVLSIYWKTFEYPIDTLAEYLPSATINGSIYQDVIHCKSDSTVGADEFYYAKTAGLVYYRKAGSSVAWRKQ